MEHFNIKAPIVAVVTALCIGVCFKLVYGTKAVSFNSSSAYEAASWLSKNDITIPKEMIDTQIHEVYNMSLKSIASNKDEAARLILGEDMKRGAADSYTSDNGTLVFSKMNFEFIPSEEYGKTSGADKYSAGKTAEEFVKGLGINVSGSVITSSQEGQSYTAEIMKTIDSLPVFNDVMTVTVTDSDISKLSGTWYISYDKPEEKRRAKSAVDALIDYQKITNGTPEEIVSMELGYVLASISDEVSHLKPMWRIMDADGKVCLIEA